MASLHMQRGRSEQMSAVFLFSAKGAVSFLAWGNAPGFVKKKIGQR
jgi:hypothetical protein